MILIILAKVKVTFPLEIPGCQNSHQKHVSTKLLSGVEGGGVLGHRSPFRIQIILQVCLCRGWVPSHFWLGMRLEQQLSSALTLQITSLVLGQSWPSERRLLAKSAQLQCGPRQLLLTGQVRAGGYEAQRRSSSSNFCGLERLLWCWVKSQCTCIQHGQNPT